MPARNKGPRLYLRRARRDKEGGHSSVWLILDGNNQRSTGCPAHDIAGAERSLAKYLASKHAKTAREAGSRDPDQIPLADVLTLYLTDLVPKHARPEETKGRIRELDKFFGDRMLSYITGETCRAYVAQRSTDAAAGRTQPHRRENLHNKIVSVVLPVERMPRDRWLTRSEAARLIRAAWRYGEVQKGHRTDRRSRQHVARFILVALYTGTRAGAVCGAALQPTVGHGWIDVERGVFYRRPPYVTRALNPRKYGFLLSMLTSRVVIIGKDDKVQIP